MTNVICRDVGKVCRRCGEGEDESPTFFVFREDGELTFEFSGFFGQTKRLTVFPARRHESALLTLPRHSGRGKGAEREERQKIEIWQLEQKVSKQRRADGAEEKMYVKAIENKTIERSSKIDKSSK